MSEEILNNENAEAAIDVIDGIAEEFVPAKGSIIAGGITLGVLGLGAIAFAIKKHVAKQKGEGKPCIFHAWNEAKSGAKKNEVADAVVIDVEIEDKESKE